MNIYSINSYLGRGTREMKIRHASTVKAMLHGAIFLATCNAILLLRDVKLPNTSLHYTPTADVFSTYRKFFTDFTN
jgi:hypothetical protein